jgi:hypothetical protein
LNTTPLFHTVLCTPRIYDYDVNAESNACFYSFPTQSTRSVIYLETKAGASAAVAQALVLKPRDLVAVAL